mmetsp:Transcript_14808/g.24098  ORF Transcript_14808/g.24098 Transcript_14808/m.24098 type:complete len:159 (-) Transcript_14808:1639-2115(-)
MLCLTPGGLAYSSPLVFILKVLWEGLLASVCGMGDWHPPQFTSPCVSCSTGLACDVVCRKGCCKAWSLGWRMAGLLEGRSCSFWGGCSSNSNCHGELNPLVAVSPQSGRHNSGSVCRNICRAEDEGSCIWMLRLAAFGPRCLFQARTRARRCVCKRAW